MVDLSQNQQLKQALTPDTPPSDQPSVEKAPEEKAVTSKQEEIKKELSELGIPPKGGPKKTRVLLAALGIFLLIATLPVAVYLVKQRQEIRKEAAGKAILLGRVINTDSQYSSCHEQRYFYGDNCGNADCHGAPNYTVTWSQSGKSKSINNNDCSPQNGPRKPRYTFEWTENPIGDSDGELATVTISMAGDVPLQSWTFQTTDSNGNPLAGSQQSGTFNTPGPRQEIEVKVYRKDDYRWNHLWFTAFTPAEPSPSPTPPGYTTRCEFCKVYDENWNEITDLSTLAVGQTIYFATRGSTTHPQGIAKARFRINNGAWQETTSKHGDDFYIEYNIPAAGSYKIESMVYNPVLGWY